MANYEESNRKLAHEYLGRQDGVLFQEGFEELPKFAVDDQELLRAAIRVYGGMVGHLMRENRELKEKLKEVRENVVLYRLKRKTRHLLGKDKK